MASQPIQGNGNDIHRSRSWMYALGFSRGWSPLIDLLIAISAFLLTMLLWIINSDSIPELSDSLQTLVLAMAIISAVSLLWRRRFPVLVHVVVTACFAVTSFGPLGYGVVAADFSLYSLGRYARDERASLLAMLLFLFVLSVDEFWMGNVGFSAFLQLFLGVAIWYTGQRLKLRSEHLRLLEERARDLEERRHLEAEQAVAEERSRIARELHDIVAHQLSLMTVQAGAAKTVARTDIESALNAMEAVEQAGRQALTEMRHLLNVLRTTDAGGELTPQPGCADLAKLAAEVSAAGVEVDLDTLDALDTGGELENLAPRVDLAIYRIVQEALTNVMKHAGDNAKVSVRVAAGEEGVELSVCDNGRGSGDAPGRGYGIEGMRERVALLGGWLTAETPSSGGFEVRAFLPYGESSA